MKEINFKKNQNGTINLTVGSIISDETYIVILKNSNFTELEAKEYVIKHPFKLQDNGFYINY